MDAGSHKNYELIPKSNTKLPSSNQNSATVVESDECFVCGDEHQLEDGVITCWAHFSCKECLVKLFEHAANTAGFSYFPARCCPGGAALGLHLAENLLTSDTVQTYKRKEYQLYLPEALLIYCPECSTWLSPKSFHDEGPYSLTQCDNYNTTVCVGCKYKWQIDHKCHKAGGHTDAKPEWLPAYTPEFRVKKCPKCRMYIEHREACNTMECSHCRHCFCFVCLIPWTNKHDCPHYNDPEEGYDEDGYEKTPRGLHRDTGLNREGRNRLGISHLLAQAALGEDAIAGQILYYQAVIGLEELDVDDNPFLPEPVLDFGSFDTGVYDNPWYARHGSWIVSKRTWQELGPDPLHYRRRIDEGYDLPEEDKWTEIIPWSSPSEVGILKKWLRPAHDRVPKALWDDLIRANVSRLSFDQLACNHKWQLGPAWLKCSICGDWLDHSMWCEECDIHICGDCPLDTSEDHIGASGHNMVSVIQWAEQGESPWKAQHRADNDWFQGMEAQLGVARMFDHYERKHFHAHPFCSSHYGIKEMFEGLEESMRRAGSWYVAEDNVGFKGSSMSFHLDSNPFAPLLLEDDLET